MRPVHLWIGLFSIWGLMLSGILTDVTGTPGVLQALQLRDLLHTKKVQLERLEGDIGQSENEERLLTSDRRHQEMEVRRVLGYIRPGELVFDFSPPSR